MINAWSLLWEELNGTMDETYPVKKKEYVDGHGDVHPVTDFKVEGVKDPSYYDYNRNDPDTEDIYGQFIDMDGNILFDSD